MMRFNAALARRVALILGLSFPTFCNALADGRAVLPPRWMVEAYLSDVLVKPSREDIARAIIPGLGMALGFSGPSFPIVETFVTPGTSTIGLFSGASTVTVEGIGAGDGKDGSFGRGGGGYSRRNSYSLSGLSALYLIVPAGNANAGTAASAIVRANNSGGTLIMEAKPGNGYSANTNSSTGTGDVRYNGGAVGSFSNAGGGAAGPSGAGGASSGTTPGTSGGSPAGAGGASGQAGQSYGGGGGNNAGGAQGWIRLSWNN